MASTLSESNRRGLNSFQSLFPRREIRQDTHPWIRFCLGAHHRQAQVAQRRTDLLSRAWIRLGEEAVQDGLDERVVHALLPAFWGSRVRRTVYQHDAELSDQQAIRDLRDLVRRGWLIAHGQARARHYGAGARIDQVQQDIRQSRDPYNDPYERR